MKPLAFLLLLIALPLSARAEATAYQALHHLTERNGKGAIKDLYLLRGIGGSPQPERWVLYRGRPNRAFFQTTTVSHRGRITSGKAPAGEQELPPDARPLDLSILNLDTHAAWNIAQTQARKEMFFFHRADYHLATHPLALVPAWTLYLYNERQKMVGIMTLSGTTGEVLNRMRIYHYRVEQVGGTRQLVTWREPWANRASRSVGRWFSRTGEAYGHNLLNAAGTTEEVLIERRTRHFSEDAR